MKKLTVSIVSLTLASTCLMFSGCSYFSSAKAPEAAITAPAVVVQPSPDQSVAVVEVQEVEMEAVVVPADPATNTDTQVVIQAVEVDAIGIVPAADTSVPTPAVQK